MKKIKIMLMAVIYAAVYLLISFFGIMKVVGSRALQAAAAGVLAAILWFAFVRKINRKRDTK